MSLNMKSSSRRKPIAIANWKMAMTVSEGLAFVKEFCVAARDFMPLVDIVLCPPFTSVHPLRQAVTGPFVELGAQNLWAGPGKAHTGEISAQLLRDAGCKWAMLGHWEVRRRTGETDSDVNVKMQAAFEAGLRPILLIGEESVARGQAEKVLEVRLPNLFGDCDPAQIAMVSVIYEPEWTIGAKNPAPPDYIAAVCSFIRRWLGQMFGADTAQAVRLVYGGSVAPENVGGLVASPDIDGLGAGRMGRDPVAFAKIVQEIAIAKGLA
jgi:triosephosphate isomerase